MVLGATAAVFVARTSSRAVKDGAGFLLKKACSNYAGQLLEGGLVLVLLLLAGDRQPDDDLAGMATGAGSVASGVAASSRTARQISVGVRTGRVHAAGLQLGEDLGEEARLGVDSQHVG